MDSVCDGGVDGFQRADGHWILGAGGRRCGVCRLCVDGFVQCDGGHLDEFPHMAGTASSLAGTFRFGIGAIVGALLSLATFTSAWPMIWSIALCAACSILFYLYASRPKNGDGRGVPQWRRRMRRRRWGRYPLHDGKAKRLS